MMFYNEKHFIPDVSEDFILKTVIYNKNYQKKAYSFPNSAIESENPAIERKNPAIESKNLAIERENSAIQLKKLSVVGGNIREICYWWETIMTKKRRSIVV